MKRLIAVLLVSACAFPAGALAAGAPGAPGYQLGVAPHLPATGTDVAAPDQQSPIHIPAPAPAPAPAPGEGGFDWGDAGIGAGSAICLAAISLGSVTAFRRRQVPPAPLAVS